MNLGISELAWTEFDNLDNLLTKLIESNISSIEMVIPKHIEWQNLDINKILMVAEIYKKYNINIVSTQSILYNSNVESFNDINFLSHIELVCNICNKIGITKLVLGAPALRKNFDINYLHAMFLKLDSILYENGQTLLIEPNSQVYSGQYFFTLLEIITFIESGKFKSIKTMIDTHNIVLENQNPSELLLKYVDYIDHVHISEINLQPFTENKIHMELAETLYKLNYNGLIVYEAKSFETLFEDIKLFSNIYYK
jgi:sugar phosphate isomerase/epimerase